MGSRAATGAVVASGATGFSRRCYPDAAPRVLRAVAMRNQAGRYHAANCLGRWTRIAGDVDWQLPAVFIVMMHGKMNSAPAVTVASPAVNAKEISSPVMPLNALTFIILPVSSTFLLYCKRNGYALSVNNSTISAHPSYCHNNQFTINHPRKFDYQPIVDSHLRSSTTTIYDHGRP